MKRNAACSEYFRTLPYCHIFLFSLTYKTNETFELKNQIYQDSIEGKI